MTYVLYSTDAYISKRSKCILDFFKSKKAAINFAKKDSKAVNEELTKDEIDLLKKQNQTKGRKENYLIEINNKIQIENANE
jgi:replicative superfamily II helicase